MSRDRARLIAITSTSSISSTTTAPVRSARDMAMLGGLLAVIAWGMGPLTVRAISAPTATIVAYRMGVAAPVMFVAARIMGQPVTRYVVRQSLLPGAIFAVSMLLAFASFRETSIAAATLIPALMPVVMLCVAPKLFGEHPSRAQIGFAILSLCAVAGVVLVASSGSGTKMLGNLIALANLGLFSVYWVVVKQTRSRGVDSWAMLSAMFAIGAVIVIPFAFATGADMGALGGTDWLYLWLMILGPGLVGHGLMTWSSKHLDITVSSLMTLASPVISMVGAWIVYSESLNIVQGVLVVIALAALSATLLIARSTGTTEPGLAAPPE